MTDGLKRAYKYYVKINNNGWIQTAEYYESDEHLLTMISEDDLNTFNFIKTNSSIVIE